MNKKSMAILEVILSLILVVIVVLSFISYGPKIWSLIKTAVGFGDDESQQGEEGADVKKVYSIKSTPEGSSWIKGVMYYFIYKNGEKTEFYIEFNPKGTLHYIQKERWGSDLVYGEIDTATGKIIPSGEGLLPAFNDEEFNIIRDTIRFDVDFLNQNDPDKKTIVILLQNNNQNK